MQTLAALVSLAALLDAQSCTPPASGASADSPYASYREGPAGSDVTVAGVFGVHARGATPYACGDLRPAGVEHVEAFLWAVRTFKARHPRALVDVAVGALAFDSCGDTRRIAQQVLNLETCAVAYGSPAVRPGSVLAYVGTDTSTEAAATAALLQDMRKMLVSHAASGAALSDVTRYPYFLRTVASDAAQAQALAGVLSKLQWRYVQVVRGESEYGRAAAEAFSAAAAALDICVVQEVVVGGARQDTSEYDAVVENLLRREEARVVLMLTDRTDIHGLLLATLRANARGRFTWVGADTWDVTGDGFLRGVEKAAEGAVTVTMDDRRDAPNAVRFGDYFASLTPLQHDDVNPWLAAYWEDRFKCHLPGRSLRYKATCNVHVNRLSASNLDRRVPHVIEAVDAVLLAVEKVRRTACPNSERLCSSFVNRPTKWLELYNAIKQPTAPDAVRFGANTTDVEAARQTVSNYRSAQNNCRNHCYVPVRAHRLPRSHRLADVIEARWYSHVRLHWLTMLEYRLPYSELYLI